MTSPLPLPAHTPLSTHPNLPLTVPSLLPSPSSPPPKRADVVSLKLRLAALLPPNKGELYWNALCEFVQGRVTRGELDEAMGKAFGRRRGEAVKLHNALLLSILYNTTRPFLPPSSVRHNGFHPRGAKKRGLLGYGDGDAVEGGEDAASEKRRRLVKSAVMALGRRERAELKMLAQGGAAGEGKGKKGKLGGIGLGEEEEERWKRRREFGRISEAVGGTSVGVAGELESDGVPKRLREKERDGAVLPATFPQDFRRLAQTPLCCETRMLPDQETTRDRMLMVAYEDGLVEGVESRAATLLQSAIEQHLKNMIASAISLVRGTRQAVPSTRNPSSTASSVASTPIPSSTSTFAPAGAAPSAPPPSAPSPAAAAADDLSALDLSYTSSDRLPLTIGDFHALFAISPGLLGQHPNLGAIERMYSIPPPETDSSDEDSEDEEHRLAHEQALSADQQKALKARQDAEGDTKMLDVPPPNAAAASSAAAEHPVRGAGKMPRLSRSRASSFYGAVRPVPATLAQSALDANGKTRFVLDPSSLHGVPEGHPDVPHLIHTPQPLPLPVHSSSNDGGAATPVATAPPPGGLSPKSFALRNALFPELASSGPGTPAGEAGGADSGAGDGNGTTDAGESDTEDEAGGNVAASSGGGAGAVAGGLKIKLGGAAGAPAAAGPSGQRPSLAAGAPAAGQPGGPPQQTTNEKDKDAGRKLWEVVDSVRLLDGVLPP
ncbi:hypothetical protein JCM11251_002112 [Rhodosporidiobolus azoricus]